MRYYLKNNYITRPYGVKKNRICPGPDKTTEGSWFKMRSAVEK